MISLNKNSFYRFGRVLTVLRESDKTKSLNIFVINGTRYFLLKSERVPCPHTRHLTYCSFPLVWVQLGGYQAPLLLKYQTTSQNLN